MALNTPSPYDGKVYKPRFDVMIGLMPPDDVGAAKSKADIHLLAVKSANCERRYWTSMDRFKVVCALCKEQDYEFWASWLRLVVEIRVWYEGVTEPEKIFHGVADKIDIDCFRGEVVISGRNTGALLVNSNIRRSSPNQSVQDQVRELVEEKGFTVEFGNDPVDGDFGFYVKGDKHHLATTFQSTNVTVWDKLARMANETGCSLYEFDGVVYFLKTPDRVVFDVLAPTRSYNDEGNVCKLGPTNSTSLKFWHDLSITTYDKLVFQSEGFHGPRYTTHEWPPKEEEDEISNKNPNVIIVANMTDEDVMRAVQNFQKSVGTREWHVEWTSVGPEMLKITVLDYIFITGTAQGLDGPYAITSIEYNIHWDRGMTITVLAEWGRSSGSDGGGAS